LALQNFFLMDSVNVQIYKIDIGKLIFVLKKILNLIEILRKLFFTCNPHFVPAFDMFIVCLYKLDLLISKGYWRCVN
jgi:hypothetical protein